MSEKSLMIVEMGLSATNEEIIDRMRELKDAREGETATNIVCVIPGFDSDPRELFDIPEVRAFCRRLVSLGFISYLDYSTRLLPDHPCPEAWGAAEIWMCSEGLISASSIAVTRKLLNRIETAVRNANGAADRTLGVF